MLKRGFVFSAAVIFFFSCSNNIPETNLHALDLKPVKDASEKTDFTEIGISSDFGETFYENVPSDVNPRMIGAGLPFDENAIINLNEVLLFSGLSGVPAELLENGFIVTSSLDLTDNPVSAFEVIESSNQPVFVSSGIALHLMHVFFDNSLKHVEENFLYADLVKILIYLYETNLRRENFLAAAYSGVALKLLEPSHELDPIIADIVEKEVQLIEAHEGFAESNVFGYKEDFSQYVPRGHYPSSDSLKRYFKAMMWLGRMTFPLKGNQGGQEMYLVSEEKAIYMTGTALQMVSDLCSGTAPDGEKYIDKWCKIYSVTAFFAGFADDMSVPEYLGAVKETESGELTAGDLYNRDFYGRFSRILINNYLDSKIYSGTGALVAMPDESGEFDTNELMKTQEITAGFRLFGQRYAFDSEVLGRMVFPTIGPNRSGERRFMPSGLDVAAVFGSQAAYKILCENGDTFYANFNKNLNDLKDRILGFEQKVWHETLYNNWLLCIYLLMKERGEGYADFMTTEFWQKHSLSNFLASWAMLRHDNILYVKQSYTMEAGCAPNNGHEPPPPSAGFVEPVPEVYAEVIAVLTMLEKALKSYGYFDEALTWKFSRAQSVMERIKEISEKELAGKPISAEDADFLKYFSSSLQGALSDGGDVTEGVETSLIADVHTDQNSSSVLEVASGNLDLAIIVYARPDGHIEAALGPVLSYWEFTWPMGDRLTDEKWRELTGDKAVERPDWIYITR